VNGDLKKFSRLSLYWRSAADKGRNLKAPLAFVRAAFEGLVPKVTSQVRRTAMSSDSITTAADEAKAAKKAAANAIDQGERSFTEAMTAAEKTLAEATRSAEKVFREGLEALRAQTRVYTDNYGERVDEAQKYIVERVKERPVTAALTGLGVGLLLGLLLSSRDR